VRLTTRSARRYSRHLIIPEVGEAGQAKLLKSKVLLIGAGGWVRRPRSTWRRRAWGRIGIVDDDVVDESNRSGQIPTRRAGGDAQ